MLSLYLADFQVGPEPTMVCSAFSIWRSLVATSRLTAGPLDFFLPSWLLLLLPLALRFHPALASSLSSRNWCQSRLTPRYDAIICGYSCTGIPTCVAYPSRAILVLCMLCRSHTTFQLPRTSTGLLSVPSHSTAPPHSGPIFTTRTKRKEHR